MGTYKDEGMFDDLVAAMRPLWVAVIRPVVVPASGTGLLACPPGE